MANFNNFHLLRENIKICSFTTNERDNSEVSFFLYSSCQMSFENCIIVWIFTLTANNSTHIFIANFSTIVNFYVWPRNRTTLLTTQHRMKEWMRIGKKGKRKKSTGLVWLQANANCCLLCAARWSINQKTSTHKNAQAFKILLICNFTSLKSIVCIQFFWKRGKNKFTAIFR